jgi:hypothetical protein
VKPDAEKGPEEVATKWSKVPVEKIGSKIEV